jgi:hypothetical protein
MMLKPNVLPSWLGLLAYFKKNQIISTKFCLKIHLSDNKRVNFYFLGENDTLSDIYFRQENSEF